MNNSIIKSDLPHSFTTRKEVKFYFSLTGNTIAEHMEAIEYAVSIEVLDDWNVPPDSFIETLKCLPVETIVINMDIEMELKIQLHDIIYGTYDDRGSVRRDRLIDFLNESGITYNTSQEHYNFADDVIRRIGVNERAVAAVILEVEAELREALSKCSESIEMISKACAVNIVKLRELSSGKLFSLNYDDISKLLIFLRLWVEGSLGKWAVAKAKLDLIKSERLSYQIPRFYKYIEAKNT